MKKPNIVVVGSVNMDLVTGVKQLPQAGETRMGDSFATFHGGKGANQAVACARLGASVHMIGCVGQDAFGEAAVQNMERQGVHTSHISRLPKQSTGVATILLEEGGENRIIVVPGANHGMTPAHIQTAAGVIRQADIVLMQLEIPLDSVRAAMDLAYQHGVSVILNPAPAVSLSKEDLARISLLTPNQHELPIVIPQAAEQSLLDYPGKIVMTKGKDGVSYAQDGIIQHQPGFTVEAVDTTGAGDTFNGALAVMLARGAALPEAIMYANAAAALSITKHGAQSGMPTDREVQLLLHT
ncbi:ribokinase [Ectobacillus ponti]|uniref:Ribokinase n=1 Tax=Ectobacillus ponti TaxID=2961894 RepID=A0AA42BRC8_9BACI|nr:ribokinase [Ectobacillus ponti]